MRWTMPWTLRTLYLLVAAVLAIGGAFLVVTSVDPLATPVVVLGLAQIPRAELTEVNVDSGDVALTYVRDGRERRVVSSASRGLLNSFGGRLIHHRTRIQQIADDVTRWWRSPSTESP